VTIVHRPQFLLDLAEELSWLNAKAGPEVAERWYESVCSTIESLSKHPELGRSRTDLSPAGIRSWRVDGFARWLLFYAVRPDALVLLRLRQGSMNLVVLDMS
jgi:plasmid stabilization system protein ParE